MGPVRSLRTSDFDLVANLGEPVVAFSGADTLTLRASKSAGLVTVTPDAADGTSVFFRDRKIPAPHNLFLTTIGARAKIRDVGAVNAPFTHTSPGAPAPAGLPLPGLRVQVQHVDRLDLHLGLDTATMAPVGTTAEAN